MGADPIGGPRPAAGARRIGPPETNVLRWVGQQYACREDQLTQLLTRTGQQATRSTAVTRRITARWMNLGLVDRATFLASEPPWIWLTRAGLREVGLPFRVWQPKAWMLAHVAAINRVRLFVEPRRPAARWVPERQLRRQPGEHPVPDAEIHDPGGTVTAVEVELSRKSTERRRQVMRALVDHYDSVWYFASVAAWDAVHDASCAVPVHLTDLVRIYSLEDC